MKIAIGSDKSGYNLKEAIKAYLTSENYEFEDLGTLDPEQPKPFFVVADCVAEKVQNGTYDRAILICGTGAGVSIVSNKYKGVHAVACESVYSAKMCRAINNAQILCMGGWIVAPEMGIEMTKAFLTTDFLQDLEDWRQVNLKKAALEVEAIENKTYGE